MVTYSCFLLHNYCEYKQLGVDEQDIQEHILRQRNEEENMSNVSNPVYSEKSEEREYVRALLTECI